MAPKRTRLTGLLHELEDLLDGLGSPFSSCALPGIDDDQIDELLAPSGIVAPTQLREWWRWHHGSSFDSPGIDGYTIGAGRWGLMDIPWALRDRADWLEVDPDLGEGGWRTGWCPIAFQDFAHGRLVARTSDPFAEEMPIGWYYVFDVPPSEPIAKSLDEVVDAFIDVIREGQMYFTPGGWWEQGPRRTEFPLWVGT